MATRNLMCLVVDAALVAGASVLAAAAGLGDDPQPIIGRHGLDLRLMALTAVMLLSLYYNGLYEQKGPRRWKRLIRRLMKVFLLAGILLALLYYAAPGLTLPRGMMMVFVPIAFLSLLFWRTFYYWVIRRDPWVQNIVILGTGVVARQIARDIIRLGHDGERVLGFLTDDASMVGRRLVNPSVIGTFEDLHSLIAQRRIDSVVVALEDQRQKLPLNALLRCRMAGIRVEEPASLCERLMKQIPVRHLRPSWLIFSYGFQKPRLLVRQTKQIAEFLLALTALILLSPVLAVCAFLIWLDTGCPVLYKQKRVGEGGKPFVLYKLRTMRQNAEKGTGPVWAAAAGDKRITRVGRFLRRSRLDEIPQLFNVLKGDMSIVGPRPERPKFVAKLTKVIPYYEERHCVKPGITGWAQVNFPYASSVEEAEKKLQYDLFYIKNMSLFLDALILAATAKVMLFSKGAR